MEILAQIKGTLALVDGIATCAIGLEANITPSDYPLIRIAPTRLIPKDEVGNRALIVTSQKPLATPCPTAPTCGIQ